MTTMVQSRAPIKVATEVWIATALLHRENPARADFEVKEILHRIAEESLAEYRPGLRAHLSSHCVAQKEADPGNFRFLTDTGRGRRRLFRSGDGFNPHRGRGPITPRAEDLPFKYRDLLLWYAEEYNRVENRDESSRKTRRGGSTRALLRFVGLIPPDDVARMERAIAEQCERVDDYER
jgi:hypothetical protein